MIIGIGLVWPGSLVALFHCFVWLIGLPIVNWLIGHFNWLIYSIQVGRIGSGCVVAFWCDLVGVSFPLLGIATCSFGQVDLFF